MNKITTEMRSETREILPQGIDILDYLDKLEPFEIFSGYGFLNKNDWEEDKERGWILSIKNTTNQT